MKNQKLILRLDDAAERMDIEKWQRVEDILDKFEIKPLVGVIPCCKDPMMDRYDTDPDFWKKVHKWIEKDWVIAMHGCYHVYDSKNGGINPLSDKSEFAGHTLNKQKEKIRNGYEVFLSHDIVPEIFFAPSHTYDESTLNALKSETKIRIVSDTVGWDSYLRDGLYFIPVQSGKVRRLPFRTITYCYHPNTMSESDFILLEDFIRINSNLFVRALDALNNRNINGLDLICQKSYMFFRRARKAIKGLKNAIK